MAIIGLTRPYEQAVEKEPALNQPIPQCDPLQATGKVTLLSFLRHVGCPFAEETVKRVAQLSKTHPEVRFILVTHSDSEVRDRWLKHIGGIGHAELVSDPERDLYGKWGLGFSSVLHFLGPANFIHLTRLLMQGIYNRDADGTRWQRSGSFLFDAKGVLLWKQIPEVAGDPIRFEEALAVAASA